MFDIDAARRAFPSLAVTDQGAARIYLDNPAGTQVAASAIAAVSDYFLTKSANRSGAFVTSTATDAVVAEARAAMAAFLNASGPDEIVFGASMTALTYLVAQALAPRFAPGDEIILTRMDHDANVSPWRQMAERQGLVVKVLDFDRETYRFDLDDLERLITPRTRLAAVSFASNIIGTINDIGAIARRLRQVGALTYVDAVQYAPHGIVDVQALDCDFLACSAYKFYGPHLGVLWGRREILQSLSAERLRAAPASVPECFERGTLPFELLAGVTGAIAHYEALGAGLGVSALVPAGLTDPRARAIAAAKTAMLAHEERLAARLIAGLSLFKSVRVHGPTSPNELSSRVSTISISVTGRDPKSLAEALGRQNIFVWHGDNYALDLIDHLGLGDKGGVLRIGPVHYNTVEEIDATLDALEGLVD